MMSEPADPVDGPRQAGLMVARRLDTLHSGSGQYLEHYLALCAEAGIATTLIFAPRRSFGNLAWARIHPKIRQHVVHVDWHQTIRLGSLYVSTAPSVWIGFLGRVVSEALRRLRGTADEAYPSLLGYELEPGEREQVVSRLKRYSFTMLTAEYSSLAPLLADAGPATQRVVFLHDLFSLRAESFVSRGLQPDHAVLSLQDEAARCAAADLVIHASCVEQTRLQEVLPEAQHVWMRPVVRPSSRQDVPARTPHAVFIGSLHAGNTTALTALRETIWPLVRAQCPDSELHIVGSIAETVSPQEAALEGLRLIGPVEDLSSLGGPDAIGLAPIEFGSGIPIKIVDYLAIAMPVVATSGAVDAFGTALDGLVEEARDHSEFAALITELLQDHNRRKKMSKRARQSISRLGNDGLINVLTP